MLPEKKRYDKVGLEFHEYSQTITSENTHDSYEFDTMFDA